MITEIRLSTTKLKQLRGKGFSKKELYAVLGDMFAMLDDLQLSPDELLLRIVVCSYPFDDEPFMPTSIDASEESVQIGADQANESRATEAMRITRGIGDAAKSLMQNIQESTKNAVETVIRKQPDMFVEPHLKEYANTAIGDKVNAYKNRETTLTIADMHLLNNCFDHTRGLRQQYGVDYAYMAVRTMFSAAQKDQIVPLLRGYGQILDGVHELTHHDVRLLFQLANGYGIDLQSVLHDSLFERVSAFYKERMIRPWLKQEQRILDTIRERRNQKIEECQAQITSILTIARSNNSTATESDNEGLDINPDAEQSFSVCFAKPPLEVDSKHCYPVSDDELLEAWEALVRAHQAFVDASCATPNLRSLLDEHFSTLMREVKARLFDEYIKTALMEMAKDYTRNMQELCAEAEKNICANFAAHGMNQFHFNQFSLTNNLSTADWTCLKDIPLDMGKKAKEGHMEFVLDTNTRKNFVENIFAQVIDADMPDAGVLGKSFAGDNGKRFLEAVRTSISAQMMHFLAGRFA